MAIIRAFCGLRPRPELASEVASPPYDVLSAAEAREVARTNPNSFLRVNKAEIDFDDSIDAYSDQVYRRGRDNLQRLQDEQIMIRDIKPSVYLYRLTWQGESQTGLVALTSVDEYDRGLIKKHEHTLPAKVRDRANHIEFLQAQVGPVLSTFRHTDDIAALFAELTAPDAITRFETADGVRHELWVVDDESALARLVEAFGSLECLYIADGHHRSQSASEVGRRAREANTDHTGEEFYNFFLNVLFADRELRILPYNRVVRDLNGLSADQLLKAAEEKFEVTEHDGEFVPSRPGEFGIYLAGTWYQLTARPGSYDQEHPTASIDAAILQSNLIGPILGVDNPKTDKRVSFVGGIRGSQELVRLVDSSEFAVAFLLHATSIAQLLTVADFGEVMPPKSTWFEPKLRSGMVVNLLSD